MHAATRSLAALLFVAAGGIPGFSTRTPPTPPDPIRANDNRRPAGSLRDGVLTVALEARSGLWRPDADDGPAGEIYAFAESGQAPQIPGPMLRVPAGTHISVTLRNTLALPLVVHGLEDRPANGEEAPITLQPGEVRQIRFRLDAPGEYFYWATTSSRPIAYRTREDSQLSGAIIVDPPGGRVPSDRVLVLGMWADSSGPNAAPATHRFLMVVNGRSWPHTERLVYQRGDTVRLRVLNPSADIHPMHLHGFYFGVTSRGDFRQDRVYAGEPDHVFTELMPEGGTMTMVWVPERAGNWLFHCHIPAHFGPRGPLGMPQAHPAGEHGNHALEGMNGLVVGLNVLPRPGDSDPAPVADAGRRRIRLLVRDVTTAPGAHAAYEYVLHEQGPEPPVATATHAAPPLILTRGQPVAITVVNSTRTAAAVHWHGIELESYFDGVAGFSGSSQRLSPAVEPGDSFIARFTPPRAGTFIYHTHMDEDAQQRMGLAGALIVLEPGQPLDAAHDLPVLLTTDAAGTVLINGRHAPTPQPMRTGERYRLRMINITPGRPGMRLELRRDSTLQTWRVVAKDAYDRPASARMPEAARHRLSIGETLDAEFSPPEPGAYRLQVLAANGLVLDEMPFQAVDPRGRP